MLIKPTYDTYEDTFQGLKSTLSEKLTQNLRCRESLNSSGTVSRKTSTASDYTPENTYVSNNRMDQSTTVSFSSDTCVSVLKYPNEVAEDAKSEIDGQDLLKDELNDSLKRKDDVKLVPGQKVDLKVFILRTEAEPHEDGDEKKDEEKVEEKVEVQAVLKVSTSSVFSKRLNRAPPGAPEENLKVFGKSSPLRRARSPKGQRFRRQRRTPARGGIDEDRSVAQELGSGRVHHEEPRSR